MIYARDGEKVKRAGIISCPPRYDGYLGIVSSVKGRYADCARAHHSMREVPKLKHLRVDASGGELALRLDPDDPAENENDEERKDEVRGAVVHEIEG